MWHYIFHGLLPWYHNLLYIYSVLDMISRPLSEKKFLDQVSQVIRRQNPQPEAAFKHRKEISHAS